MIEFDEKVEIFLRHQMSEEEENSFLSELQSNPDKLKRAQVIALSIQEMGNLKKAVEQRILQIIKGIDKTIFFESIWASPKMEEFDEQVNAFLRKEMNSSEEKDFLTLLEEVPSLKNRAKTIALVAKEIKDSTAETDQRIIQAAKRTHVQRPAAAKRTRFQRPAAASVAIEKSRVISMWSRFVKYSAAACVVLIAGFVGFTIGDNNNMHDFQISEQKSYALKRGEQQLLETMELQRLRTGITDPSVDITTTISKLDSLCVMAHSDVFNDYTNYLVDIEWSLVIAYLADGNKQDAIRTLNTIIEENEGNAIADRAKQLLKKIR